MGELSEEDIKEGLDHADSPKKDPPKKDHKDIKEDPPRKDPPKKDPPRKDIKEGRGLSGGDMYGFDHMDNDNDGKVSLDEILNGMAIPEGAKLRNVDLAMKKAKEFFRKVDSDTDLKLDFPEFGEMFKQFMAWQTSA